ncbi:hypothetical protein ACLMJK_009149 [Lecanora helva]
MANVTGTDCAKLVSRQEFSAYIVAIKNATAGDLSRASQCQAEICNALWGSGNLDISGIGVYKASSSGRVVLIPYLLRRKEKNLHSCDTTKVNRCASVVRRSYSSFFDCAVFLTFSIQIPCIVVLARLDFGVSANGMGDSTAKITWAVSLLTLLPLTYSSFNSDLLRDPRNDRSGDSEKKETRTDRRGDLRFLLFALCWMLFIYPFLSRMMETFGPSKVGGDNHVISTNDWDIIVATCTRNVSTISDREETAMKIFSVAGSIPVCVLAIGKIVWLAMIRQHEESRLVHYVEARLIEKAAIQSQLTVALLVSIPIIAVSQLWTILRLRTFQKQIAQASGNEDLDSQWTFGQIASVTVFVPVAVECWFSWHYRDDSKPSGWAASREKLHSRATV